MSAAEFLKGPCQHCGNSIEFPADGIGQTTTCPHCGQATELQPDVAITSSTATPARKSSTTVIGIIVVALIAVGGVIAFKSLRRPGGTSASTTPAPGTEQVYASTKGTNRIAEAAPPTKTSAPKSLTDLKTGTIAFEKARGSSLVHAVGVLRNESDHQRFGVTIELELTDARGNKAGTAKDYRAVLEPRQEWRFRALVLDSKATAATVSSIREE